MSPGLYCDRDAIDRLAHDIDAVEAGASSHWREMHATFRYGEGDTVLDDALCPWHQQYYSARPNFIHPYDGPIRHRLAVLARADPQ